MSIRFTVNHTSGNARAGILQTPHGEIRTPFFMPVGTAAAVKGLTPAVLRECGAQIVLANTYHLAIRPGEALIKGYGGVSAFMGWHGPTLTDSGGYQAFSLAEQRKLTEEGVRFRNHIDGGELNLTPERSVQIQQDLGPDMFMALDECPPGESERDVVARAVDRTTRWAARCREAWTNRERQALFGIVQGGRFDDLRLASAQAIAELDLPGNAIGGVSVGEPPEEIARVVEITAPKLPANKPRYLMGVGHPQDILRAVRAGVDMFDCVIPTRHARHAQAITWGGGLNLRNACFREDQGPIEDGCDCYACRTVSRGYIRHLFQANEMLGPIYLTMHNLRFYFRMMQEVRDAIAEDRFAAYADERLGLLQSAEA